MKILLLSPHTDDVELGCGGSVIKYLEENNEIHWIVYSIAEASVPEGASKNILAEEFLSVTKYLNLGEGQYSIHQYPVRKFDQFRQDILEDLVAFRNSFHPDIVIGPSLNDFHQDHAVIANEMVRAFKTSCSILSYELPWNQTTFSTQMFIKLTKDHMKKKIELLDNYISQRQKGRQYFSEEYIYGLAKTRGVQCNADYAEAFEVIRWMA